MDLENNLLLLDKFRKQLWEFINEEEEGGFRDYLNDKYKIYSRVCDTVEIALQTWEVDDSFLDSVFLQVKEKMWDTYTDSHWFLARAILILEWNQEAIDNEKNFIEEWNKAGIKSAETMSLN